MTPTNPAPDAPATATLDEMAERRPASECTRPGCCDCPDMPRCPVCNYTAHDAAHLMDHSFCHGVIPGYEDKASVRRIAPGAAPAGDGVPDAETRRKAALFAYLMENSAYSYPEDFVSPSPPEFGISWEWQATTPERPDILDVLISDATKWIKGWLSDIDIDAEPQDYDREMLEYADALQVSVAPVVRARLAATPSPARSDRAADEALRVAADAGGRP